LDNTVVHETVDNKAVALIDLLKNSPDNMSPEDRGFLDGTVVHKTVDNKAVALIDLLKNHPDNVSPEDR
jgi:hypothetical protein